MEVNMTWRVLVPNRDIHLLDTGHSLHVFRGESQYPPQLLPLLRIEVGQSFAMCHGLDDEGWAFVPDSRVDGPSGPQREDAVILIELRSNLATQAPRKMTHERMVLRLKMRRVSRPRTTRRITWVACGCRHPRGWSRRSCSCWSRTRRPSRPVRCCNPSGSGTTHRSATSP